MQIKTISSMLVTVSCMFYIACNNTTTPGNGKFTSAAQYDSFITTQVSLLQQILFAVQQQSGSDSTTTTEPGNYITQYSAQIDSLREVIKKLPGYNNNTAYRDAAVRLADFYKKSVDGYFTDIEKVYAEVKDTSIAIHQVDDIITKLQEEETVADADYVKQKEKFATDNNIQRGDDEADED